MPKWTDSRLDLVTMIGNWSSGKGPLYGRLARSIRSAIESGELTPTLKVKRKKVTERYRALLDAFYAE